jgi:hypothetical protein
MVRPALRNHFLPSGRPKMRMGVGENSIFQVVGRPCEHILCLLAGTKRDLGEVEKAMFQMVARPFEHIFGLLAVQKCDVDEAE